MLTAGPHFLASLDIRHGPYDQVIWPDLANGKGQEVMGPTVRPDPQNCKNLHSHFPQSASWMSVPEVTSEEARPSITLNDHMEQNLLSLPHLLATTIVTLYAISKLLFSSSIAIPGFLC